MVVIMLCSRSCRCRAASFGCQQEAVSLLSLLTSHTTMSVYLIIGLLAYKDCPGKHVTDSCYRYHER